MSQPTILVTGASKGLGAAIAALAAVALAMRAPRAWTGEIIQWDEARVQELGGDLVTGYL